MSCGSRITCWHQLEQAVAAPLPQAGDKGKEQLWLHCGQAAVDLHVQSDIHALGADQMEREHPRTMQREVV